MYPLTGFSFERNIDNNDDGPGTLSPLRQAERGFREWAPYVCLRVKLHVPGLLCIDQLHTTCPGVEPSQA